MLYNTANPHGGDIYGSEITLDFSANINPLGPPENVTCALIEALENLHFYPDPYCRELVQAISLHEGVKSEQVLCGNGASELIYAFSKSLKPKRVMLLAPTFSEYALSVGDQALILPYELQEKEDFLVGEDLIRALREQRPEILFLCNPNNPTGQLVEKDLLLRILQECEKLGCLLFLDECFMDLSDRDLTMKEYLEDYQNLVILKALTKSYGLAGLRVGYVLSSNEELLQAMSQETQPWNVSSLAQVGAKEALAARGHILCYKRMIKEQRPVLREALQSFGFRVVPSEVNFLLFKASKDLGRTLLERGIKLRDCSNYQGLEEGWYRVCVRDKEDHSRLIKSIEELI